MQNKKKLKTRRILFDFVHFRHPVILNAMKPNREFNIQKNLLNKKGHTKM